MDTVDPRVERTRGVVLGAVAELLTTAGFERITVEAISEATGVARSTIYRNWPSIGDLLVEAFEALCRFDPPPDTGSLEADLLAVGTEIVEGLSEARWGQAFPSFVGAVHHDPELRAAQQRFSSRRRELVASVFSAARERGEIGDGLDAERLAEVFVSPFFFRKLVSQQPLDAALVDAQVRLVMDLLGAAPHPGSAAHPGSRSR